MSRKSEISARQKDRTRQLSREGYSANKIQKTLQQEHIGLRRTELLRQVRESKNQPAKPSVENYVPRKYRELRPKYRTRIASLRTKQVTLEGRHYGERVSKKARGSGRQLYRWIIEEMDSDFWDAKPQVFS